MKTEEIESVTYYFFLLLLRTRNSVYKNYSFEAWKLLVSSSYVKSNT